MSGLGQYSFTAGGGANQGGPTNPGTPNRPTGTYSSNLEDLSNAIRKPLPLRQQTDKPTLRYNGIITSGHTGAPLMLTSHSRPPAVPLFSQSDIQYLRQQVQQYSTPPTAVLNNVLFTSFVNKAQQPAPGSMYTITNGPVSNLNVNVQAPPAQPYPPLVPRNPYARPISAQEIQPPDGINTLGSRLMPSSSSSSSSSLAGVPSPVLSTTTTPSVANPGLGPAGSPAPSAAGVQTNVFMKPQATHLSNGSTYKSEKRSTHSTINVKETKLGSVIYKPSCMTPPETSTVGVLPERDSDEGDRTQSAAYRDMPPDSGVAQDGTISVSGSKPYTKPGHVTVNAVIKSNSSSIIVTVPRPPSGSRRSSVSSTGATPTPVTRAQSHSAVTPVLTRAQSQVVKPETYGFVTNIPNHPGPKGTAKQNAPSSKDSPKAEEARRCKDSVASSNKLMNNMIPKSSIPRPGTAARSRPGSSTSRKEDSPCEIRNLNYTPTKPYHEVNNNRTGSTESLRTAASDPRPGHPQEKPAPTPAPAPTPEASPDHPACPDTDITSKQRPSSRTLYYHKTSKTEVVLHRPPLPRPRAEGASTTARHTDRGAEGRKAETGSEGLEDDEWEDEAEDGSSCTRGERFPGDGEDVASGAEDDDSQDTVGDDEDVGFEDDGIDGLEDDMDEESDEDSLDVSRAGSARSRTTLRIRSATKRLLGLSLHGRRPAKGTSRPSTARTRPVSAVSTLSSDSDLHPALTPSLFPNIPPTINFVPVGEKVEQLPFEIRKQFKWRMSPITPNVVKNCIQRSGFKPSKKNHDWLGYWGKHMKAQGFKAVREYQKVNHFPGSFQIGRKDRLWRNLSRLQVHYGKKEFGFFPQTFVLPPDLKQLKRAWEEGGNKQKWIIKPPASARGIGIRVIHKWNQIPRKRSVIVQRYLSRPYLINDSKFDLRIYVYVTSYDPLRVYVYDDGLVRFASCKYSQAMKNLSNKYMHLTNYSINKKNNEYQSNSDDNVCQGHKWSLKALWGYMKKQGINTNQVWQSMLDLIVKTIISSESAVNSLVKANVRRRYSCHELFGFDIMLDDMLKPWIIEVNISPSLHSNSQLDINVKGGMIKDLMNLAGFMIPGKNDVTPAAGAPPEAGSKFHVPPEICMDRRLYPTQLSPDEKAKHAYYCQRANDEAVQQTLLDVLTPDDIRILTESIDEETRRGNFIRAFPNRHSHKYLRFFEAPRYCNLLLDAWINRYHRMEPRGILLLERHCEQYIHLETQTDDPRHQWGPPATLTSRDSRTSASASGMVKIGVNANLPKLKKRADKPRAAHSLSGGSSHTSSTMSIGAGSDPFTSASSMRGTKGSSS